MLYRDNPFYILGASLDMDRRRIVALAEEKALLLDSAACAEARTTLTNPQRRIAAEVNWFLDCSDEVVSEIKEYISDQLSGNTSGAFPEEKYSALTQLNIKLAGLEGQSFSSPAGTRNYVLSVSRLFNSIRSSDVMTAINNRRTKSGFPQLSSTSEIDSVIAELRGEIRQRISHKLQKQDLGTYTNIVTRIAESYSGNERYKGHAVLEDVISEYQLFINDTFQAKTDNLTRMADRISRNLKKDNLEGALADLIEDLYDWDRLAQPLQLVEMTRGSIHKNSESLLLKLRGLSLKLHNDGGYTQQALELTTAMQDVFKELPKYEELLSEDAGKLKDMAEQGNVDVKYAKRIDELQKDAELIINSSEEKLDNQIEVFLRNIRSVYGDMVSDGITDESIRLSSAYIGRGLAIDLNNKRDDTNRAIYLINELKKIFSYEEAITERLNQDARDLYKIKLDKEEAESIIKQIDTVKYQLNEIKFAPSNRLGNLVDALLRSVKTLNAALKKTGDKSAAEARENLAFMVRETAIDLHNRRYETELALSILLCLGEEFGDVTKFSVQNVTDIKTLNQLISKNPNRLKSTGSGSIGTYGNNGTQKKKTSSENSGCLVSFIVLAVVALIFYSVYSQSSSSAKTRTPTSTPAPAVSSVSPSVPARIEYKPDSASPSPSLSNKPQYAVRAVANGQVLKKPDYEGVCPLEIRAGKDCNYYIYLEYKNAPGWSTVLRHNLKGATPPYESDMAFYVKAGTTVEVDVPVGVYKLYYATGDTFYGESALFGDETQYYSSDDDFDFYADSNYFQGHTLTLYSITNGNLETEKINKSDFPK